MFPTTPSSRCRSCCHVSSESCADVCAIAIRPHHSRSCSFRRYSNSMCSEAAAVACVCAQVCEFLCVCVRTRSSDQHCRQQRHTESLLPTPTHPHRHRRTRIPRWQRQRGRAKSKCAPAAVTMLTVRSGPRTPRALCARAQERLSTRPFLSPLPPCRSPMLPPSWCMCVCVCPRPARIFTQTHILALCMPPPPPPHTTNTPTMRHRRASTQHQHEKTEREERREKREARSVTRAPASPELRFASRAPSPPAAAPSRQAAPPPPPPCQKRNSAHVGAGRRVMSKTRSHSQKPTPPTRGGHVLPRLDPPFPRRIHVIRRYRTMRVGAL